MIKKVLDRLEGIEKNKLLNEFIELLDNAEELGLSCRSFLYEDGTRDNLLENYDKWKAVIDCFYEKYVK